jgi:hydroxymethylglutaryl-CoA lyase
LQNEATIYSVAQKLAFVQALAKAGLTQIEAGAFVRADKIPQLADTDALFKALDQAQYPNTVFSALVPNGKGLQAALAVGVKRIAVFTAASDAFTQHNIGCTIQQSLERFKPVVDTALQQGVSVRGYVSTVVQCPYQGRG